MKYVNATTVLPTELVKELQKYVQGETIYVPSTTRKEWGACSGTREWTKKRNCDIKKAFQEGRTIYELAEQYFLAVETIKKIVYKK
ncbi:hypothetical protein LZP85_11295 [Priestia flexa]|uniref:Mor transcription activator domain-containing protein n=2 Tax=Priestia TaxID=2800373 RepID=A0A0V8JN59_9BACI|nr:MULTISPECIES: CD3324 family protein [Bacillaceae]AQX54446.1 hypothetical protein BC359_09100 [Priestia flexa]KSU88392.1 hypothetical protein AS180_08130 [Priestia veravalensis]KZB91794.1 hypothetical protein A2U94_08800 [Bacillus sp. VT 712]MBN8251959.1 hypothetical protein [Priestia flexa]MBN8435461.1 hypothetical protein [Priestia flexa]